MYFIVFNEEMMLCEACNARGGCLDGSVINPMAVVEKQTTNNLKMEMLQLYFRKFIAFI